MNDSTAIAVKAAAVRSDAEAELDRMRKSPAGNNSVDNSLNNSSEC